MSQIVPKCTGKPDDCVMCEMIKQIFEGFPKENDPGCELEVPTEERDG